jgi:HAD superfamily hydrolase (TIGR01509 family)
MMKYRAVLFDFDGTLTPSLPLWLRAFQQALAHFGVQLDETQVRERCFFKDWHEIAQDFGVCTTDQLAEQVDVALTECFLEAALFPGAQTLIEHCRRHGAKTAIVTSSTRRIVTLTLARLGITTLFDYVICADDVQHCKPHPEPIFTTLAALQCAAHEAIMVGDSHVDILAGKAAGTATALFFPHDHHRFHSFAQLQATLPDHIVDDHAKLHAVFAA